MKGHEKKNKKKEIKWRKDEAPEFRVTRRGRGRERGRGKGETVPCPPRKMKISSSSPKTNRRRTSFLPADNTQARKNEKRRKKERKKERKKKRKRRVERERDAHSLSLQLYRYSLN